MTYEEACGFKKKEPETVDLVNNPPHYTKHKIELEPLDLLQHLPFCLGNCLKYIIRAKDKENELQDLKKARFYLQRAEMRGELDEFKLIAVPCLSLKIAWISSVAAEVLYEKTDTAIAFDFLAENLDGRIARLEQSK